MVRLSASESVSPKKHRTRVDADRKKGAVTNVVFFKKCVRRGPKLREPYETTALIKLIAGSAVALPLDHRRHRSRRWRLEALNARRIKSPLETGESHVQ